MPAWYWAPVAVLAFSASVLLVLSAAYGREWPAKPLGFVGMAIGAWAILGGAIGGTVELIAWLT